ncbi:hypothetical protein SASPL_143803 [Salvia splendens]|uniref:Uncharacterized protein n=1 Tax=Salvia splendens TaxID=180675 RepID=A0A8X8ZAN5_SALSN|nr:hypothetical protein SASPL_143803 [Salvia splendens]
MYGPQPYSCSDWEQPGVLSDYYELLSDGMPTGHLESSATTTSRRTSALILAGIPSDGIPTGHLESSTTTTSRRTLALIPAGTTTPTAALRSPKPELGLVFARIAPTAVSACEKPDLLGSALPKIRSPCWKDSRSPVARTSATADSPKPVVPAAPKPEPEPHVPKL